MSEINDRNLHAFVEESNRIEGMSGVRPGEIAAHLHLLGLRFVNTEDLEKFVAAVQPGAALRDKPGMDVQVGGHIPPPGGPDILRRLRIILIDAGQPGSDPWLIHQRYEHLHPFTDGNGRSGRALWLRMMAQDKDDIEGALALGFLHTWYYQTLSHWGPTR